MSAYVDEVEVLCECCEQRYVIRYEGASLERIRVKDLLPQEWVTIGDTHYCSESCYEQVEESPAMKLTEYDLRQRGYEDTKTLCEMAGGSKEDISVLTNRLRQALYASQRGAGFTYFQNPKQVPNSKGRTKWMIKKIDFVRWLHMREPAGSDQLRLYLSERERGALDELIRAMNIPNIPTLVRLIAGGVIAVDWAWHVTDDGISDDPANWLP